MNALLFVYCAVALAIGVAGGFAWGRIFSRRHPLSKEEMDALIDEAYRLNAEGDFKKIRTKAIKIADLANAISAITMTAEESVSTSNVKADPGQTLPPDRQSFEAKTKSGDDAGEDRMRRHLAARGHAAHSLSPPTKPD